MLYTLRFFSSKCSLFHNANFFGSCIIHILYTGCAEIKKKKFRRQRVNLATNGTECLGSRFRRFTLRIKSPLYALNSTAGWVGSISRLGA